MGGRISVRYIRITQGAEHILGPHVGASAVAREVLSEAGNVLDVLHVGRTCWHEGAVLAKWARGLSLATWENLRLTLAQEVKGVTGCL